MAEPVWSWPVEALARALRARRLGAEELVRELIERARVIDARLHCFTALDAGALDVARRRDAQLSADPGALHGVPFAAKDVFAGRGAPPSAGARRVRLRLGADAATVLDRLDRAGAVSLGRLNLDPFGYAATGVNPEFGDTRNPWDPRRIAGGSSSGAAAAVAAGVVPFALGADTGGSVRIPSAFCGVTGLKPTYGRISKRGVVPLSYTQDTVGVIARSALDVADVLEHLAGHDPLDPGSVHAGVPAYGAAIRRALGRARPLEGIRVGIDHEHARRSATNEIAGAIAAALHRVEELGARVVEVDVSALGRYDVAATVLTWGDVSAVHARTFAAQPEAYPAAMRARLELALACHGADHADALRYQGRALQAFLDGPLTAVDAIVAPVAGIAPPTVASLHGGGDAVPMSLSLLRLNRPFNFVGVPAVSVPIGFDADGLPIGAQIVARPWAETLLLTVAAAYQTGTDWHRRRPDLARDR